MPVLGPSQGGLAVTWILTNTNGTPRRPRMQTLASLPTATSPRNGGRLQYLRTWAPVSPPPPPFSSPPAAFATATSPPAAFVTATSPPAAFPCCLHDCHVTAHTSPVRR